MTIDSPPEDLEASAARAVDAATLLNHAINGFFLADRQGRILQCNQACLDLLSYEEADFVGRFIQDFDVQFSAEEVDCMIESAAADGHLRGESRVRTGRGEEIDVSFSVSFVPTDGSGCFFGFFEDITERRRAERALRESEARWRSLAEGVNAALFIYQEGTLVYANEATSRITGYDRNELLGMPVMDFMHADYLALYEQRAEQAAESGTPSADYRAPLRTKDGMERWIAVSLAESSFNNRPAILGIGFDITDQVRADGALRESRKDVEALALRMSRVEALERRELGALLHDGLAQDLVACRLQISDVLGQLPSDSKRDAMTTALNLLDDAIRQSRDLIHDLAMPVLHEFGIDAALTELCKRMESDYGTRVVLEKDRKPKPLSEELLDLAYRATREFLLNAMKYAEASEISVRSARKGDEIVIAVRDDGKGFDPARLRKTVHGGDAGFGLFFVSRRIRHIGGVMDIDAQPGNGARVTIALPIAGAES